MSSGWGQATAQAVCVFSTSCGLGAGRSCHAQRSAYSHVHALVGSFITVCFMFCIIHKYHPFVIELREAADLSTPFRLSYKNSISQKRASPRDSEQKVCLTQILQVSVTFLSINQSVLLFNVQRIWTFLNYRKRKALTWSEGQLFYGLIIGSLLGRWLLNKHTVTNFWRNFMWSKHTPLRLFGDELIAINIHHLDCCVLNNFLVKSCKLLYCSILSLDWILMI